MAERRSITVLHVSDMQFGAKHRFGSAEGTPGDQRYDTLAARLLDDLVHLREEHGVRPDLIVASGDLTERGWPVEFDQVSAFLGPLAEGLKLPRSRVVMVPGNHDVNRRKCASYFADCEEHGRDPVPPYWPKWEPYATMFANFYRGVPGIAFPPNQPWTCYEMADLKTVVAGLNSTMAETHLDGTHYGSCGEEQFRWFARRLGEYRRQGWLRIGVLHHNPVPLGHDDDSSLRDADKFEAFLAGHLNLVLHGHTHAGKLCGFGRTGLPVFRSGSAGVRQEARPEDTPNQYQLIEITGEGFTVYARRYNPTLYRWEGDTGIGKKPEEWTYTRRHVFEEVDGTFPKADTARDRTEELRSVPGGIRTWYADHGTLEAILLPLADGHAAFTPDDRSYKLSGDPGGAFWWAVDLCRFEPGECDDLLGLTRLPEDAPITTLPGPTE